MAVPAVSFQLRAAAGPSRSCRRAGPPARPTAARASLPKDAARAAVVGALLTLLAAPLLEAPANAFAASEAAVAAAEKEGAARLKACSTDECRAVITSLNEKKLAKLKGETAPPVKASAKAAAKVAPAPAPQLRAPKPAPAAVPSKPAGPSAESAKKAAEAAKKAVEAKKAAAVKAAEAAKREAERKRKQAASSAGTNPLLYVLSFFFKVAFAAGALAAPFIFLNKEDIVLDEQGAIDTEKAKEVLSSAAADAIAAVPNKEVVLAYGIGSLVALAIVDGIINLPLLNVLIGAPVQILGFVTALALGVRYLNDGKDAKAEAKELLLKLNGLVPEGLPKPVPEDSASV